MALLGLRLWTSGARCGRCGLTAKAVGGGRRKRYKVNADVWAARCKALKESPAPATPFECPHLRAATQQQQRAGDAPHEE